MAAVTGPRSLKERQRQEREQLILQAAEELLVEQGFHETAIDAIAERVGISKGTVYLHFASKEELVFALIERGMRSFVCAIDATLAGPGTPREKLQRVIELMYGSMGSRRFQLLTAIFQSPEFVSCLAERRRALAGLWEESAARLSAVVDEGKVHGDFDPALPTPVILSLLGSLLTPPSYQRLVVQEQMPLGEVIANLSRFFFKGIAAAPSDTDARAVTP